MEIRNREDLEEKDVKKIWETYKLSMKNMARKEMGYTSGSLKKSLC